VPQPEGNDFQGYASLEQMKSGGVPERMWRNPALPKRRAGSDGDAHCASEAKLHAGASQRSAASIAEERVIALEVVCPAPLLKELASLGPERNLSLLAALAMQPNHLALGVGDPQLSDLGNAGARVVHEREESPVSLAAPRRVVAGREDCGDLLPGHESNGRFCAAFERDREESLTKIEVVGSSDGQDEMREAANRRESGVAGANSVMAVGFEVIEEREHRLWRQRGEGEPINGTTVVIGEETQEQPEGIAVSGDGLRTDVALRD
jgi:hypothetical protein